MAAAGGVASVLPVDVDEEVAGLLCEAAVELDIAAGASPVMAVCTALAHAGHQTVARVLA
jgi:hypothetical protein